MLFLVNHFLLPLFSNYTLNILYFSLSKTKVTAYNLSSFNMFPPNAWFGPVGFFDRWKIANLNVKEMDHLFVFPGN